MRNYDKLKALSQIVKVNVDLNEDQIERVLKAALKFEAQAKILAGSREFKGPLSSLIEKETEELAGKYASGTFT